MRPRNYSMLSVAQAGAIPQTAADAELEFLHDLEDAIQALGSSRFTADGRPASVAAQTRARLGEAIKELTESQISTIADGAEKFGNTSLRKIDQRVLLEVVQGDAVMPDAQVQFPENNVSAQYIFYNDEQKEDARLLQELKRIQYLQHVVMKQLEMTDRSGSTQVVQGMIASGQKFVAGLTAVFKQVETLSRQIERGLQNKAEMPTAEQKTVAIAAITQALRALPAIDPRHIAVKNMVMQQVERLQQKFNVMPSVRPTAPRVSAAVVQMKTPIVEANADVKMDAKPTAKAAPVAKTNVEAKAEVKAAPVGVQAKAEIRTQPTAPSAPSETMRQMSASVAAIAPNVSVQQTVARVGNASPVAVLQQSLLKAFDIAPVSASPVSVSPVSVAPLASTPASTPVATISNTVPVSVGMPVQSAVVQNAPVVAQAQVVHVQAVQAPRQQTQPAQTQAVQQQLPQQAQQRVQHQQRVATQEPLKAVEPVVPAVNQAQQPITTTPQIVQPAQTTQPPAQPTNIQPTGISQPIHVAPVVVTPAAVTANTPNNVTTNTVAVTPQAVAQSQSAQASTDATRITKNANADTNATTQASRATIDSADNKGAETRTAADKTTPADAKKSDAVVEKNPERPTTGERSQEAKGEKETDKKKDVAADSGCNTCTTKNCGACRVSSLQGNGSTTVQYGNTNAKGEQEAKAKITENAAKCAGCGGCGPGGCSRVAADPNVVAAATNAALDKLGTRRRAAPALTPAAAA